MKHLKRFNEEFPSVSEGWFSKREIPESEKESCRKSIIEFMKRNLGMDLIGCSDEELLLKLEPFARNSEYSDANKMAKELFRISKPILGR